MNITATLLAAAAVMTAGPALACDTCNSAFKPGTYTGEIQRVGNGVAYSWVTLNEKGKPSAIGVTMTETALTGLPQTPPEGMHGFEYVLKPPIQAMRTPFDHIVLGWNPKGHEPDKIYDVPHFDFHFYTITQDARMKITAKGDDLLKVKKPLPAEFVAPGYLYAPGAEVPEMGAHWVDSASPEFHGQPFTKTFIYGSYNGKPNFWEPMITKAYLETQPNVTETIKLPSAYPKDAYYPTSYSVKYDPARKEYTIALEGLSWQTAAKPSKSEKVARGKR